MGLYSFLKSLFKSTLNPVTQPATEPTPTIDFPGEYTATDGGVGFATRVNGRRVGCEITYEGLQYRFHVLGQDVTASYLTNRDQIHNLARQLILRNPTGTRFIITQNNP